MSVPHRPPPALVAPPLGFAHRGFTPRDVPGADRHAWENTLAAFQAAVDTGLRHLETDVRASADGVAVVVHDADLARTTGAAGPVEERTWAELARYRVAGHHPLARVEQLLEAFPDVVLNIDVKAAAAVGPLARAIAGAGAKDRVVVAAFDGRRSRAVQALCPGVARSADAAASAGARLAAAVTAVSPPAGRHLLRSATRGADALQLPQRWCRVPVVTPRLVSLAHDVGVQVHVWTVDDPDEMRRLLAIGVDGLMSDRADLLTQVLPGRAG